MKRIIEKLRLGGIRLAKSLTFWSVILGFLLAWDYTLFLNLYRIWNEQGLIIALQSREWNWFLPLIFIFLALFGLFFITERKQNTKTEETTQKIISSLEDVSGTLKAILEAIRRKAGYYHGKKIEKYLPCPKCKS